MNIPGAHRVVVAGEPLLLLPHKAAYWERERMLMISDMHCGKAATFRARQVPVPEGSMRGDFERLTQAITLTGATALAILGDWIHAAEGCTHEVMEQITSWRAQHAALSVHWIRGNHDRLSESLRARFGFDEHSTLDIGPFRLKHHPKPERDRFVIAGHIHPRLTIGGHGFPRTHVPCFDVRPELAVLPAFSSFTAGYSITPSNGHRIFLAAGGSVVEWKARARPRNQAG